MQHLDSPWNYLFVLLSKGASLLWGSFFLTCCFIWRLWAVTNKLPPRVKCTVLFPSFSESQCGFVYVNINVPVHFGRYVSRQPWKRFVAQSANHTFYGTCLISTCPHVSSWIFQAATTSFAYIRLRRFKKMHACSWKNGCKYFPKRVDSRWHVNWPGKLGRHLGTVIFVAVFACEIIKDINY